MCTINGMTFRAPPCIIWGTTALVFGFRNLRRSTEWGTRFLVQDLKEEPTSRSRWAKNCVSIRTEMTGLVSMNSANSVAGFLCCGANHSYETVRFPYNPAGVPAYIRRWAKAEEYSRHNTNRKELRDYFYTPLEWVEEGEISICMQSRWGTVSLNASG